MKKTLLFLCTMLTLCASAQQITVQSPDSKIAITLDNQDQLTYSVSFQGKNVIAPSPLGFELKGESPMGKQLALIQTPIIEQKTDSWKPVVANKHSFISLMFNETTLMLQEKGGECRRMDVNVRAYNDGIAFRYQLFAGRTIGDREITREVTGFAVDKNAYAWVGSQNDQPAGSAEVIFHKKSISDIQASSFAHVPFLVEINKNAYLAITDAFLDNYPGFFIGATNEGANPSNTKLLTTKLAPLPNETPEGVKARFDTSLWTPWRVVMIADNPGKFIESEMIRSLNPPCAIEEPSWIKPGMCAWDHWWSGEVKMEMPVIKQYIDMAAEEGWPYMLVDWQWYGPYNRAEADPTRPAPQLDFPELLNYAKSKSVKLWVWMYSSDVNNNCNYDKAFAEYEKWGVVGVKIDFMDRVDQQMVRWYRMICQKAAEHHLLVDFHGAYRPDGIDRTYPNQLTREGVMGEEYYKFSDDMTPEHNITLAFTRMLAGAMDYTPGGFLNVRQDQFKQQSPTLVSNTRAAELAKFVIYESPYTVVSEHPDNLLGKPGADFLKTVSVVWDDTHFISGYPDEYIALAKRDGERWFIGVLNNSQQRDLTLDTSFLPQGNYQIEYWADGKKADKEPTQLVHKTGTIKGGTPLKIRMANAGGYTCIISRIE